MRLTTKGRYAVTAVLDVALHRKAGPVSLAAISSRQRISQSYLEQLFGKLKRADLVRSLVAASVTWLEWSAPPTPAAVALVGAWQTSSDQDGLRVVRLQELRPHLLDSGATDPARLEPAVHAGAALSEMTAGLSRMGDPERYEQAMIQTQRLIDAISGVAN